MTTQQILKAASAAKQGIMTADAELKKTALNMMAEELCASIDGILSANKSDIEAAQGIISQVMLDRLTLTPERISGMAEGIRTVAALPDPAWRVISSFRHKNGMSIDKISVPLGVVAIIYESRPNVTSDAAALAIKSGNACILRCGKEAHASAEAITRALKRGITRAGLNGDILFLIEDISRKSAEEMMKATGLIDLLIPRGGASLIKSCTENAKVPCIETGTGICHVYVDATADTDMAVNIVDNAKTSRPSVCNAEEVLLVHEAAAAKLLPALKKRIADERAAAGKAPVRLLLDSLSAEYISGEPADSESFDTEFLDYILAVKIVSSLDEAIAHIAAHSTHHSDCIITEDAASAERFTALVDSAAVYVNASTRFTDGGEFGLGCEMGISTQKLHARGPMGLNELNTYKYVVRGSGQIR